jgi:hypothetical protein
MQEDPLCVAIFLHVGRVATHQMCSARTGQLAEVRRPLGT